MGKQLRGQGKERTMQCLERCGSPIGRSGFTEDVHSPVVCFQAVVLIKGNSNVWVKAKEAWPPSQVHAFFCRRETLFFRSLRSGLSSSDSKQPSEKEKKNSKMVDTL